MQAIVGFLTRLAPKVIATYSAIKALKPATQIDKILSMFPEITETYDKTVAYRIARALLNLAKSAGFGMGPTDAMITAEAKKILGAGRGHGGSLQIYAGHSSNSNRPIRT